MARAVRQAAAPQEAAPVQEQTPEDEVGSVYDEIWGLITSADPKFAPPSTREDDQTFIKRLCRAVNDVVPADAPMSPEAEAWWNVAADQFTAGNTIDAPPGFNDDGAEAEAGNGADPDPPAQEAVKRPNAGAAALAKWREEQKAKKAAAAQAPAPAAPAPGRRAAAPAPAAPAPGRRTLATPAPAAPARAAPAGAPRRGAAPAPAAPAPGRRAAPVAEDTGPSMASLMRRYIITYPDCTGEDVMTYITSEGYAPKPSSVAGVLTFTKNTIREIQELNHWK